jgi:MFS family permease
MTTTASPSDLDAQPSARRSARALWGAAVVGGMAQSVAGSAGSLLAREVGGTDAVAGLPQSFLVAGSMASAVALVWLTPRIGRGAALGTASGVAAVGAGLAGLAAVWSSLAAVLLASALMGAGNTAVMLSRYAAADLVPMHLRARAMGLVLAATSLGAVAGPNLLGPAGRASSWLGGPALAGPYIVAFAGFVAGGAILAFRLEPGPGSPSGRPPATTGAGRHRVNRLAVAGLLVLGVSNLVMVGVMTMAPVHLLAHGTGLGVIGLVVSGHIAGMFAPSPLSGWLTDRFGHAAVTAGAGATLLVACVLAARGASSTDTLVVALILLGLGWNLALVSGSAILTTGSPASERPRREAWGELSMGVAAVTGGAASGFVVATGGYEALAWSGAAAAAVVLLGAWAARTARRATCLRQPRPTTR